MRRDGRDGRERKDCVSGKASWTSWEIWRWQINVSPSLLFLRFFFFFYIYGLALWFLIIGRKNWGEINVGYLKKKMGFWTFGQFLFSYVLAEEKGRKLNWVGLTKRFEFCEIDRVLVSGFCMLSRIVHIWERQVVLISWKMVNFRVFCDASDKIYYFNFDISLRRRSCVMHRI